MKKAVLAAPILLFIAAGVMAIVPEATVNREAQQAGRLPYMNPSLPIEERVSDLVSRMTLEEKIHQMRYDAPAIERLGIPEYNWWNECLHGVARAGLATVFPQAIGLAATWDRDMMFRLASAVSDEARAKHHEFVRRGKRLIYQGLTFWSPNINIFRDPRWGRGQETYGEDPYLTGEMAVRFIKGLQGDDPRYLKTVATSKHYAVHSGPEPDRHVFDARVSDRDLQETYLPHFRKTVVEGDVQSVMCAYNRFRGDPCCGSGFLLTDILRRRWGFRGYVVSDCWALMDFYQYHKVVGTAPEAGAMAVKAGTDLNCGVVFRELRKAVEAGLLSEADIDASVKRLFTARMKLGMFDPSKMVPYAGIPFEVINCEAHRRLALEAARKSIVLLKNEGSLLPLAKDLKTIAVIGPNADDVEVLLGNYNGIPSDPVTPLRGIREKVSRNTRVVHALGCEWAEGLPVLEVIPSTAVFISSESGSERGLTGEYFDNREFRGEPVFTRIDRLVEINWFDGSPDARLPDDDFGVRWTGYLAPTVSGSHLVGGEGFNGFRIYLNGELLVQFDGTHHSAKTYKEVSLEAGKRYPLKVEFFERSNDASMKLLWRIPGRDLEKEALEAAGQVDAVVMVMGLSPRLEGEEMDVPVEGFSGGDRLTLDLPRMQEDLLKKVQAFGKPVVLILLNGSALSINWASQNVPAILEAWYPGQAAGTAIADVLFGDYNPAGRLPVTFYRTADDLPPFNDYAMEGKTYRYFRKEALYPFGFGLSYTRFAYKRLQVPRSVAAGEEVEVSVEVENMGEMAGEEVVQLYVRDLEASVPVPICSLQGFERIFLKPGEKKAVCFRLNARQMSIIDEQGRRVVEPGIFEIAVGGGQPGVEVPGAEVAQVLVGRVELTGPAYVVE
ncbi:MAG: glycoside hydrolase family 3 C-terminal domain-containing protein [Candidatus Aminicenantales bacterium]